MIKEVFPPKEVGAAFGALGPIMELSAVGGPILAGWLVGANVLGMGWRASFAINAPVGRLALLGARWFLPANRPNKLNDVAVFRHRARRGSTTPSPGRHRAP